MEAGGYYLVRACDRVSNQCRRPKDFHAVSRNDQPVARPPADRAYVSIAHIYSGYAVPPHYDSLIGKIIAHGETRESAIARMTSALSEVVVEGIRTNVPLHQEIFQHAAFKNGGTDISYLEKRLGLS